MATKPPTRTGCSVCGFFGGLLKPPGCEQGEPCLKQQGRHCAFSSQNSATLMSSSNLWGPWDDFQKKNKRQVDHYRQQWSSWEKPRWINANLNRIKYTHHITDMIRHYITWHYITWLDMTVPCITYIHTYYKTLHTITKHYITLHNTT